MLAKDGRIAGANETFEEATRPANVRHVLTEHDGGCSVTLAEDQNADALAAMATSRAV